MSVHLGRSPVQNLVLLWCYSRRLFVKRVIDCGSCLSVAYRQTKQIASPLPAIFWLNGEARYSRTVSRNSDLSQLVGDPKLLFGANYTDILRPCPFHQQFSTINRVMGRVSMIPRSIARYFSLSSAGAASPASAGAVVPPGELIFTSQPFLPGQP